jgi:hypothetical protein
VRVHTRLIVLTAATAVLLSGLSPLARIKTNAEFDKTFDFTRVKTFGWNPMGAGEVKMARTKDDDPEAMRKRAEPMVVTAVASTLKAKGLQEASSQPDLVVTYYLLLSTNMTTQTMGQFLPATVAWGLPVFAPATQSMSMMNRGSLVLDLGAKGTVVWRGVAQAEIKPDTDDKKRAALIQEAVRDLFQRFPPKP